MKFTKMHGIGNDYVYVNCLQEQVERPEQVARWISDRHFGVGADGLILIKPCDSADFEMEMYNADGSRGAMCGNGIRCVAKYVYDYGLTEKTSLHIATGSGIKELELTVKDGKVSLVKVDMGAPRLRPEEIPVRLELAKTENPEKSAHLGPKLPEEQEGSTHLKSELPEEQEDSVRQESDTEEEPELPVHSKQEQVVDQEIQAGTAVYRMTCVSMGNPHCIVPVEDVDGLEIEKLGPLFEHHACFPDRVNTEFIRVLDRHTVQMRVWERGSGETYACGTGACAVAVACSLNGWTEDEITVKLRGGDLNIRWDKEKNTVLMTGPATVVFDGEITLPEGCR